MSNPKLIERAKALIGAHSNRAVLDLALRRLIATQQKGTMIDGIAELPELPENLHAPVVRSVEPSRPSGQLGSRARSKT